MRGPKGKKDYPIKRFRNADNGQGVTRQAAQASELRPAAHSPRFNNKIHDTHRK